MDDATVLVIYQNWKRILRDRLGYIPNHFDETMVNVIKSSMAARCEHLEDSASNIKRTMSELLDIK